MASMSYCRFENTANDLSACLQDLEDFEGDLNEFAMQLNSEYERAALHRLIGLCQGVVNVVKILDHEE